MLIKIRFNTDTIKMPHMAYPEWRVIYEGQEHLAKEIKINVPAWTTSDIIETGELKWHITCEGKPQWNDDNSVITIISV